MGLILAFVSALVYGCADFCGGKATRRAAATTVTCSSQLMGLAVLAAGVALVPADQQRNRSPEDLAAPPRPNMRVLAREKMSAYSPPGSTIR